MENATKKRNNDILYLSIFLYFLMFFSNDTYLFGTNSNSVFISFARYYMIFCCVVLVFFFGSSRKIVKAKNTLWYILFCIVFLLVCILNNDLLNYIVIKLLCFTVGFLISCKFTLYQFAKAFIKVVSFIVVCALFLVLIAYINPNLVLSLPKITNTAGVDFYSILIAGMDENMLNVPFKRIGGIFWEPGVFQIYINIALMFQLFIVKKFKSKTTIILVLGVLFTFSTTGIIVLAWLLFFFLVSDRSGLRKLKNNWFPIAVCVFLTVMAVFVIDKDHMLWNMFFEKFKTMNTTNGSAMVRKAGIITNIEIALDNPIHGIGIQNMKNEFILRTAASPYLAFWTEQNTNTFFAQFSTHGILFGLLFAIGTFRFCKAVSKRRIIYLAIFVSILMLYTGENLQYSTLPFIIAFFGFAYRKKYKFISNKRYSAHKVAYENSIN